MLKYFASLNLNIFTVSPCDVGIVGGGCCCLSLTIFVNVSNNDDVLSINLFTFSSMSLIVNSFSSPFSSICGNEFIRLSILLILLLIFTNDDLSFLLSLFDALIDNLELILTLFCLFGILSLDFGFGGDFGGELLKSGLIFSLSVTLSVKSISSV